MVLLLCQSMTRITYDLDLAIGSANAASVGGEPHLCGHCYCLLKTVPLGKVQPKSVETGAAMPAFTGAAVLAAMHQVTNLRFECSFLDFFNLFWNRMHVFTSLKAPTGRHSTLAQEWTPAILRWRLWMQCTLA